MMAHIEMKAMEKFPIDKLSYDLKLELFENMDPWDVIELLKVNQGFRSIVLREPWRIFGKHVDFIKIWLFDTPRRDLIVKDKTRISVVGGQLAIKRASDGLLESSSHFMEPKTGLTLFSKIRSCQKLTLLFSWEDQGQEAAQLPAKLLRNLDSVSKLGIYIDSPEANIEKYLKILTLSQIDSTELFIGGLKRNEQMLGVLSDFFVTKLKHCKRIEICGLSSHSFWYEPLSKIWTEMIVFEIPYSDDEMEYESFIYRIITKGIPSSNPEAAILFWDYLGSECANNSITGLLSRTPGICQIAHEDRGGVQGIIEKMLLDGSILKSDAFYLDSFGKFLREGVYFTRSIDSNRKCIYVTEPSDRFFFVKYITIG